MSREDGLDNNNKDNNKDISLEDLISNEKVTESKKQVDYEDEYVYGDSEDVDYSVLGYDEDEDEEDGYANPTREVNAKGKYSYLLVGDEEDKEEEPKKLTLPEKVSKWVNGTLDFVESKRFTTIQWLIALGVLIGLGVLIVVLLQAGGNLESNVEHQEGTGAKYVAQEVAPEEYTEQEEKEDLLKQQQEELDAYVERNTEEYARQTQELGEVPEGSIAVQDIDGKVNYVTEEEYAKLLSPEVRENTLASEDVDKKEAVASMEVEIIPSSEDVWHEIQVTPLDEINKDDIYQSRGQFIYFMQKAVPLLYAQSVLSSDFDTSTYTMSVELNPNAVYKLPEDFEQRMRLAYESSGYQTQAPNQFTIEYRDGE